MRNVFRILVCAVAVVLLASLGSCTDDQAAAHALAAEGFKNIHTTGWQFGCGKDDGTCTGFEAVGPSGMRVVGVVGCGWFIKGCTVRITQ